MTFWSHENLRGVLGGVWEARPSDADSAAPRVLGLSTDTRTIREGHAFLALHGERFDAHEFLADAARAGAGMLIVDRFDTAERAALADTGRRIAVLRVPDTARALLRLGGAYRRSMPNTRVVAVGGSNGKTTTTRLIDTLLASSLRGTASRKSYNNSVGVPTTILSASASDQYLVCEVGTNAPGEVAALAAVVEPDIAVITSIGREHLEGFGSLRGVAEEEATLINHLRPGGLAVINAEAPFLSELARCAPNVVTFGRGEDADLRVSEIRHVRQGGGAGRAGIEFRINDRTTAFVPMIGAHNALNAVAAMAVGRRLGIDEARLLKALANASGPEMRLECRSIRGIDIINDAYNANPESMLAALRTLTDAGRDAGRRVAVLGDMLELGEQSPSLHEEVLLAASREPSIDVIVLVGERMVRARTCQGARGESVPDLEGGGAARIASMFRPGDTVLLKGSRRVRLERVLALLEQMGGGA